jgi:2-polyprenyl-3-methyl-5-hydroxy-6-metoxy-1,4-benzoquinol methylase
MDQPDLSPARHRHALDALARVNFLSNTAGTLFVPLARLHDELGTPKLRILDVASGGGDVALGLWRRARRAKLDWRIAGCDISPVAVEHAREKARREDALVHFYAQDVLRQPLVEEYDAVVCSLFLHHLEDKQAVALLRAMSDAGTSGTKLLLVSDLERCRTGLWLAHIVGRLLTTSSVVHTDGPRSVRAAFTPAEAERLAEQAGLSGATVQRCWPFRWLLTWRRPS